MKNSSLFCFLILLAACSPKQNSSSPEKSLDSFFETYKSAGPRKAIGDLLGSNKYISAADADSVGVKLERMSAELGDLEGFEKVEEKHFGNSLMSLTYLMKYSRQPIRFRFKYYKPGGEWKLQDFSYQLDFLKF